MSIQEIIADAEKRMKQAVDAMTHDFSSLRTGRANPAVLERVHVEYYGSEVPVN
ncbi:ribosome recycling factor, partial [Acinetobacter baumannii]